MCLMAEHYSNRGVRVARGAGKPLSLTAFSCAVACVNSGAPTLEYVVTSYKIQWKIGAEAGGNLVGPGSPQP
jgi:hypothetical protein